MMASISYRYICLFHGSILVSPLTHQSKLFCVITYSANLDRISVKQRTTYIYAILQLVMQKAL